MLYILHLSSETSPDMQWELAFCFSALYNISQLTKQNVMDLLEDLNAWVLLWDFWCNHLLIALLGGVPIQRTGLWPSLFSSLPKELAQSLHVLSAWFSSCDTCYPNSQTHLKLDFSLFFTCFINIKPHIVSATCWIIRLMGLYNRDQRYWRNTDLPKWFIKHKQLCLAGRPTPSEAFCPAQVPALSLLTRDPKVGGPQRHLVTEQHTAGKHRHVMGCLGKLCTSYLL